MSRPIVIGVPEKICNEQDDGKSCLLLKKDRFGEYRCNYFEMPLVEEMDEDNNYRIIPCQDCIDGGYKEDKKYFIQQNADIFERK